MAGPKSLNAEKLISELQAKRLALAYLRTFGQSFKPWLDAGRGASLELASLVAHPRVQFAQSPYAKLPRDDVHPSYRRLFGPYYLVTLLDNGTPAVQIAVSALATEYAIGPTGLLMSPHFTGNDFFARAVPVDGSAPPLSPEEAVELAATASGARVQAAPELVLVGSDYSPAFAKWRLELETPVTVKDGDGRLRTTRTLLVGSEKRSRFAVPEGSNAAHTRMELRSTDRQHRTVTVLVPIHAGRAAAFTRVTLNQP